MCERRASSIQRVRRARRPSASIPTHEEAGAEGEEAAALKSDGRRRSACSELRPRALLALRGLSAVEVKDPCPRALTFLRALAASGGLLE
eukprot:7112400-Prymnesium_polylepis.1